MNGIIALHRIIDEINLIILYEIFFHLKFTTRFVMVIFEMTKLVCYIIVTFEIFNLLGKILIHFFEII